MSIGIEYRIGKKTFIREKKPSRGIVVLEKQLDDAFTEDAMPMITHYAQVEADDRIRVVSADAVRKYHGEQINEADIKKNTFLGRKLKARLVYVQEPARQKV